jgi:hypothetical protein
MPRPYLVLWRRDMGLASERWIGENTNSKVIRADSALEAAEQYGASTGEYLVLSLDSGEHFQVSVTVGAV